MTRLERKLDWLLNGGRRKRNWKRYASKMLRKAWKEYITEVLEYGEH